jgi:hypothetical protein
VFEISGKVQVALLAAILAVLAVVFLVTHTVKHAAYAYTDAEEGYLNTVPVKSYPFRNADGALNVGRSVCTDLHNGVNPFNEAQVLLSGSIGNHTPVTTATADGVVVSASLWLCPDTFDRLAATGIVDASVR